MKVQLKLQKVKKAIDTSRKRRITEQGEIFEKMVIETCKLINKQLRTNKTKHLDLSDKVLMEELKCSKAQAKKIRVKLSELKIIKIYEIEVEPGIYKKQRQTGKGTYPNWVPNFDEELGFVKKTEEAKKPKKKMKPVEQFMKPEYCVKYRKEIAELREMGAHHILNTGEFMALVHTNINEWIASKGKTRDDFRL